LQEGDDPIERDALIYSIPEVEFKLLDLNISNSQSMPAVPELTSQNSNQLTYVKNYKNQMSQEGPQSLGNGGPINSNTTTVQIRSV
jgi:hypothetical protein